MRGYLQRLAASASRPERRVRPLVGSIFAEGLREENVEEVRPQVAGQTAGRTAAEPGARAMEPQSMRAPHETAEFERKPASWPVTAERSQIAPLPPGKAAEAEETV